MNTHIINTVHKQIFRVVQPHMYTVYLRYTVILAGKSPRLQSYTVYINGSGQLYKYNSTGKSQTSIAVPVTYNSGQPYLTCLTAHISQ